MRTLILAAFVFLPSFLTAGSSHPQTHMVPTDTPPSLLRSTAFKGKLNHGIALTVFCIPSLSLEWVMEIYKDGRVVLSPGNGYFAGMVAARPTWAAKGSPTVVVPKNVLSSLLSKSERLLRETRFPEVQFDGVVDSIKFVLEAGHMFAEFREPYSGQLADLAKEIQSTFDMCLKSGLYVKSDIFPTERDVQGGTLEN